MLSVMNSNDFDLDRTHDCVEAESPSKSRVSEDGVRPVAGDRSGGGAVNGASGRESHAEMNGSEEEPRVSAAGAVDRSDMRSEGVSVSSGDGRGAPEGDDGVRDDAADGGAVGGVRIGDIDSRVSDGSMELRGFEAEDDVFAFRDSGDESAEPSAGAERFGSKVEGGAAEAVSFREKRRTDATSSQGGQKSEVGKSSLCGYDSMLSMFDEYVANGRSNASGSPMDHEFEIGDMVWGKVKSHPWWPGHIYNDAFGSSTVRKTKREGNVLVAFYGDSSYGWFDPAELLPFDSHYAEKSQQTISKSFGKAVEEAVDEAIRRRGLGLVCRCRNPYNFRPTDTPGYYAVDVVDYDPGAVYPLSRIAKERESFYPRETLDFIRQLALRPKVAERPSIEFVKNKATVFAYRRAVFEEFDETYAQAFGQQPERPSRVAPEAVAQPSRAPLSGPLVIAEALGKGKSSSKPVKTKDQSKKDKYLLKRRDDQDKSKTLPRPEGHSQPASIEGSLTLASGDYVLQKRSPTPPASLKSQTRAKHEQTSSLQDLTMEGKSVDVKHVDPTAVGPSVHSSSLLEANPLNEISGSEVASDRASAGVSGLSGKDAFPGGVDDVNRIYEPESGRPVGLKHDPQSVKKIKKAKVLKRPVSELGVDKSTVAEKKKKRKKELAMQVGSEKGGPVSGKVSGTSVQSGWAAKEEFGASHQKKEGDASASSLSDSVVTLPIDIGNIQLEIPQLLSDLQAFALNPFYGVGKNSPAIVRHVFLRFRSLVYHYQKYPSASPVAEAEPNEVTAGSDNSHIESRDLPVSKPLKPSHRPDDPTKGGRKRGPSDRQEEIAAKRVKKISQLKTLTGEKKAVLKSPESQRRDGKEAVVAAPIQPKPVKLASVKKYEPPVKIRDPTTLVMKFAPLTNLPSGSELKARLARFGPLDHSGTRVFFKSATCRVVFLYKADAQAAHKHLTSNSTLFGSTITRSFIRDSGLESEPAKEGPVDTPPALPVVPPHQPLLYQQSSIQLKSCLKKSTAGDETNGARGTPRVKFMLGGEDSKMVGNKNNSNNNFASFADGGSSTTTSLAMDFNSKNLQKVIPSQPPILPISNAQFSKSPTSSMHFSEVEPPRNSHNLNAVNERPTLAAHSTTNNNKNNNNVEFAQKMIGLMTRCDDVVNNVESFMGYLPYHPL